MNFQVNKSHKLFKIYSILSHPFPRGSDCCPHSSPDVRFSPTEGLVHREGPIVSCIGWAGNGGLAAYVSPLVRLRSLSPTHIYVPPWLSWGGINDRFAIVPRRWGGPMPFGQAGRRPRKVANQTVGRQRTIQGVTCSHIHVYNK